MSHENITILCILRRFKLDSVRTLLLPAADEVIIMNRELCDSMITDMIPELVDVALTCHGAYTPALPMSACNDKTDLGQEPDGAIDIFGHNNVNPVIKMFPKLISRLEWNIVSIFHDYGMGKYKKGIPLL